MDILITIAFSIIGLILLFIAIMLITTIIGAKTYDKIERNINKNINKDEKDIDN